jgi:hypothetical protein
MHFLLPFVCHMSVVIFLCEEWSIYLTYSFSFPCYFVCIRHEVSCPKETPSEVVPLMKRQSVVTHTIHQTAIPALLDSCCKYTFYQNVVSTKKKSFFLYFCKIVTYVSAGLLRILQVFHVSHKTVYPSLMTNCCFMAILFEYLGC